MEREPQQENPLESLKGKLYQAFRELGGDPKTGEVRPVNDKVVLASEISEAWHKIQGIRDVEARQKQLAPQTERLRRSLEENDRETKNT